MARRRLWALRARSVAMARRRLFGAATAPPPAQTVLADDLGCQDTQHLVPAPPSCCRLRNSPAAGGDRAVAAALPFTSAAPPIPSLRIGRTPIRHRLAATASSSQSLCLGSRAVTHATHTRIRDAPRALAEYSFICPSVFDLGDGDRCDDKRGRKLSKRVPRRRRGAVSPRRRRVAQPIALSWRWHRSLGDRGPPPSASTV
jgi:hypothetical protein